MSIIIKGGVFGIEYLNYAHDMRGRIINAIAEMETNIDWYICEHFCNTYQKRVELKEAIISTKHLTFQAKAEIFKNLLITREDATTKEANKAYDNLLNKIAANRNIIAHCPLDTSKAAIDKFNEDGETISFIKYLHTKKVETFNKADRIKLMELIQAVSSVILLFKSPTHKMKY